MFTAENNILFWLLRKPSQEKTLTSSNMLLLKGDLCVEMGLIDVLNIFGKYLFTMSEHHTKMAT